MNYKKFKNLKKHFMSTFKKQLKTKILLGLLIIGILCILPFIALKYGASGEGLLGYFGAIIGGSIGALVAGWGIVTTIKENRRQAVAPCLIFQEAKADKIPEGSVINSCWIIRDGEDQIFQIIKVKNVGSDSITDSEGIIAGEGGSHADGAFWKTGSHGYDGHPDDHRRNPETFCYSRTSLYKKICTLDQQDKSDN